MKPEDKEDIIFLVKIILIAGSMFGVFGTLLYLFLLGNIHRFL